MGEMAGDIGRRAIAIAVLIAATYLAFKVVIGLVTALVWVGVAVVALFAVVWAVRTL